MSKMSELDIELHNAFGDNPSREEIDLFMSIAAAMLPNARINPTMNALLDDGDNEALEFIAELATDEIVWVPINSAEVAND